MLSKVTLLAAALALCLPALADEPSKPTQTIAKPPASKGAQKNGSKNASNSSSKSLTNFGGTPNSGVIDSVEMTMVKNAKNNNADQKKQAQAARGSTRGGEKVPGKPTVIPPEK